MPKPKKPKTLEVPKTLETMTSEQLAIILGQNYQKLMGVKDNIVAITQELEKRNQRHIDAEKESSNDKRKT